MRTSVPPITRGAVRQGGKEELRASILKTYLLRVRAEKGDRAASQLLASAGIDPGAVDNETGWVSQLAAKRALRAIAELLGREAIRRRGEWTTHPEALGFLVRMLRASERPRDAYRYLAQNAREATRVGTWELDVEGESSSPTGRGGSQSLTMIYRSRSDAPDESSDRSDFEGDELLCDARLAELASYPLIWGLAEADVTHDSCIARGADACVYRVHWHARRAREGLILGTAVSGVACGTVVGVVGGPLAGGPAATAGAARGARVGYLEDAA